MKKQLQIGTAFAAIGIFALITGCSGDSTPSRTAKPATQTGSSSGESNESESTSGGETASSDAPAAGGWGTLSGRFVLEGNAPTPTALNINKDVEFCTKNTPVSEELVVDAETKGISNIVLMLYLARGQELPEPRESAEAAAETVDVDNQWCRFEPHVQFVQTGSTVQFGNEDEVGHNVSGSPFKNPGFNQLVPANGSMDVKFEAAETVPFAVSCTIHPWMKGWVVVKDHPYVAISSADGSFELANVPSGKWEFQLWQEKAGYLKQLKLAGKTKNLNRGRLSVSVYGDSDDGPNESNALGEIMVPASNFE